MSFLRVNVPAPWPTSGGPVPGSPAGDRATLDGRFPDRPAAQPIIGRVPGQRMPAAR